MHYLQKIFCLMDEKKLKSSNLAKELNINPSTLSTWKKRETDPPIEYVVRICKFLDITPNELFGYKENSKLSDDEKELLHYFNILPKREQIKWIGKLEEAAGKFIETDLRDLNNKIG